VSGSKRGHGGWTAMLLPLTAGLTIAGCQDGYPIEATPCDRYCDLGLASGCGDPSPAGCVLTCEEYWGWTRQPCSDEFDAWVSCNKQNGNHLACDASFVPASLVPTDACQSPQQTLNDCMRAHAVPHAPASAE
jgi:hypothetical protein